LKIILIKNQMKKIKFLLSIVITLISFLVISCDGGNEPLDPALLNVPIETDNCNTPTNLQTSSLNNGTTINLTWNTSGIATSWEVEYGLSDTYVQGGGTKIETNAPTVNINVFAVNSYTFSVRAKCGNGFTDWSEPKYVIGVNPNCANPSNISAVRSTTNPAEVTVNWTAPATQTAWEITYGAPGFNPSQGTNTVQASTKPKLVSGLATSSYDFYVRSKCSTTENSNWVGPINVAAFAVSNVNCTGNYLLTGFTSSTPTDINADGVSSNNILSETSCYNNLSLKLLSNNTFTVDSKGAEIIITLINNVDTETIVCFNDPIETGTWVLNGTTLTLNYAAPGPSNDYTYNPANNTLTAVVNSGEVVGTTNQGTPITLTTNLTLTFTKQ
jgi:hypothetical protein